MPSVTPIRAQRKIIGWIAVPRPWRRKSKVLVRSAPEGRQFDGACGQVHLQEPVDNAVDREGQDQPDGKAQKRVPLAEAAGGGGDEDGGSNDESRDVEKRDPDCHAAADPEKRHRVWRGTSATRRFIPDSTVSAAGPMGTQPMIFGMLAWPPSWGGRVASRRRTAPTVAGRAAMLNDARPERRPVPVWPVCGKALRDRPGVAVVRQFHLQVHCRKEDEIGGGLADVVLGDDAGGDPGGEEVFVADGDRGVGGPEGDDQRLGRGSVEGGVDGEGGRFRAGGRKARGVGPGGEREERQGEAPDGRRLPDVALPLNRGVGIFEKFRVGAFQAPVRFL